MKPRKEQNGRRIEDEKERAKKARRRQAEKGRSAQQWYGTVQYDTRRYSN